MVQVFCLVLVRGVGGVCGMCLARGGEGGEWMREFGFWISATSYYTGQLFLLANQKLPFLLLVDIGYSVVLF